VLVTQVREPTPSVHICPSMTHLCINTNYSCSSFFPHFAPHVQSRLTELDLCPCQITFSSVNSCLCRQYYAHLFPILLAVLRPCVSPPLDSKRHPLRTRTLRGHRLFTRQGSLLPHSDFVKISLIRVAAGLHCIHSSRKPLCKGCKVISGFFWCSTSPGSSPCVPYPSYTSGPSGRP
jgi:hypothetical protein